MLVTLSFILIAIQTPAFLATKAKTPAILSCIAGLHKCVGVPDISSAKQWGCVVDNITSCSGETTEKPCRACMTPLQMRVVCVGQGFLNNYTSQDATPVTFNLPVEMSTLYAEYFEWGFPDGSTRKPHCVIPQGGPANEPNEGQTIAIIGDSGGWNSQSANSLKIVGDLMLIQPDGNLVSAKGLEYSGPDLNYETSGIVLLSAIYEPFSLDGETLDNSIISPNKPYPNHCQALFPSTTHRIKLLFNGGPSLDGLLPITPDRLDIIQVLDADLNILPSNIVLGIADLGPAPIPQTACEKENWVTDGDNYLDVCLKISEFTSLTPTFIHLPCGTDTQITPPKGLKFPCQTQTVPITF